MRSARSSYPTRTPQLRDWTSRSPIRHRVPNRPRLPSSGCARDRRPDPTQSRWLILAACPGRPGKARHLHGQRCLAGSNAHCHWGRSSTFNIQGDNIYVGSRLACGRHAGGPTPAAAPAPPVRTVGASGYLCERAKPSRQFSSNADNTFSLQEGGQAYKGIFVANGNTVELNISGGPKTTATIEGNNLTDSGGQVWVLGAQPTRSAGGDTCSRTRTSSSWSKPALMIRHHCENRQFEVSV